MLAATTSRGNASPTMLIVLAVVTTIWFGSSLYLWRVRRRQRAASSEPPARIRPALTLPITVTGPAGTYVVRCALPQGAPPRSA